jgi:hypothetical protein
MRVAVEGKLSVLLMQAGRSLQVRYSCVRVVSIVCEPNCDHHCHWLCLSILLWGCRFGRRWARSFWYMMPCCDRRVPLIMRNLIFTSSRKKMKATRSSETREKENFVSILYVLVRHVGKAVSCCFLTAKPWVQFGVTLYEIRSGTGARYSTSSSFPC